MSIFLPLPDTKYDIIYADPPWNYKGQRQHSGAASKKKKATESKDTNTGGAQSHYNTVKLNDLKKLDVASIAANNCLLYMWVTSPHLDQGIELMRAWGFTYTTIAFIWVKDKTNPGYYTLSQAEICIVGKKGKIPKPRGSRNERQIVHAPRTEHSEKPEEVAQRITRMHPTQKKIELFSRTLRNDWDFWGDQVPKAA